MYSWHVQLWHRCSAHLLPAPACHSGRGGWCMQQQRAGGAQMVSEYVST